MAYGAGVDDDDTRPSSCSQDFLSRVGEFGLVGGAYTTGPELRAL